MTDTVLDAAPDDLVDVPEPAESSAVLPSERLDRLAELAAAALELAQPGGGAAPMLSEQALADVWAAVDASTATATKAAYRSDWARFTTWTTERRFRPAAGATVGGRALRHGGGGGADLDGEVAVHPGHVDPVGVLDQPVPHRRRVDAPGRAEVVRRALSGIRRIRSTPPNRRAPLLLEDIRTLLTICRSSAGVAGGGRRPPRHGAAVDGFRRRAPPQRTRRAHPCRCHPAPDRRSACPAPVSRRPIRRPAARSRRCRSGGIR